MQISNAIRTLQKAGFTVVSDKHPNGATYRATKPGAALIQFHGDCFGGTKVAGGFGLPRSAEPDGPCSFAPSLAAAIRWAS